MLGVSEFCYKVRTIYFTCKLQEKKTLRQERSEGTWEGGKGPKVVVSVERAQLPLQRDAAVG